MFPVISKCFCWAWFLLSELIVSHLNCFRIDALVWESSSRFLNALVLTRHTVKTSRKTSGFSLRCSSIVLGLASIVLIVFLLLCCLFQSILWGPTNGAVSSWIFVWVLVWKYFFSFSCHCVWLSTFHIYQVQVDLAYCELWNEKSENKRRKGCNVELGNHCIMKTSCVIIEFSWTLTPQVNRNENYLGTTIDVREVGPALWVSRECLRFLGEVQSF